MNNPRIVMDAGHGGTDGVSQGMELLKKI